MNRGLRVLTSLLFVAVLGALLGVLALNLVPAFNPAAPTPAATAPAPSLPAATVTALPPVGAGAPLPDAATLKKTLDKALGHDGGGRFSAAVTDMATGSPLYDRKASVPSVPASSLKIATAAAVLAELGADTTLPTSVVRGEGNSVVLVGGGDVLLGAGPSGEGVVGHAGLKTLAGLTADAVLAEARTGVGPAGGTLEVMLDDSLFTGAAINPVWDESLMTTSNITAVGPIALYGARQNAKPNSPRVADPALTAASTFRNLLAAALAEGAAGADGAAPGVAKTVVRAAAPEDARELATVESAPLRDQLRHMGLESDNYVAEAMGRLVAIEVGKPATFGGAVQAVQEALARLGVDTTGMSLSDTSGLSAANRVSPGQLAGTLRAAAASTEPDLRDLNYLLPIAGATGTLTGRLEGDATRGLVRAKTGSLSGVATLTGTVVTRDGRLLAFSFFAHDVPGSLAPARAVLDRAASALAGCGCR
jgi:D-alanyl-D-alanine carboxypeptidase/D-alanyl-D-alanine-endopeptidase (penicillin-binding protein 4)